MRLTIIIGLLLLTLLPSCSMDPKYYFHASVPAYSAKGLTLREWAQKTPTPLILWPPPTTMELRLEPRLITPAAYTEMYYAGPFITPGVEPPMYMLYQGNATLPVGEQFLTDYNADRPEVTVSHTQVTIAGNPTAVELRTSSRLPDSGVALFTVADTRVAFNWRHLPQEQALQTLETTLVPITPNDTEIIAAFDEILQERSKLNPEP